MNKKILIIDDEEPVRKIFSRILKKNEYEVFEAENGKEAITFLEDFNSASIDLIMLDMNMPHMNGLEFLHYIRENKLTGVPVLMVSGSTDAEDRVASYKLGAYDFITKPEQAEVMLKRVENGLKIGEMIHFNEFIKVELMMAKKLQKYLYPDPELKTDIVNIATWAKPLSDIGGDLYDYIEYDDGKVVFFVGDVTGHSISAALFTAIIKMVFRNAVKQSVKPDEIVTIMNQELTGNLPIETFVTMFCGCIDPENHTLYYTNAGHPKPFFINDGEIKELEGNDSFIGPIANAEYTLITKDLHELDNLYIYTDGILDIMDQNEDQVGKTVLKESLGDESLSLYEKFTKIRDDVTSGNYKVTDDCTLMFLQFKK